MKRELLLSALPPYLGKEILISKDQDTGDIIREVLAAHAAFAPDYDIAARFFSVSTPQALARELYQFCKSNFDYDEQDEHSQATMAPAAMLEIGRVDCKNYANFCCGVVDALNRSGATKIPFAYRFASYKWFTSEPHHVFCVLYPGTKNEIWIDPTPNAKNKKPVFYTDKIPKKMALKRIAGAAIGTQANNILDSTPTGTPLYDAIQTLLRLGIMDVNGNVSDSRAKRIVQSLPASQQPRAIQALQIVSGAKVGGLFSNIWNGIKSVALSPMRNAFLLMVKANVFGTATKLYNATFDGTPPDKSHVRQAGWDKVMNKWSALGGDKKHLEDAYLQGATHKAILGNAQVGAAPAVPAWVATAGAIIAAIMPIVSGLLKEKQAQTGINYEVDPATGQPYGGQTPQPDSTMNISEFLEKYWPFLAVGVGAVWYLTGKRKKVSGLGAGVIPILAGGVAVLMLAKSKPAQATPTESMPKEPAQLPAPADSATINLSQSGNDQDKGINYV